MDSIEYNILLFVHKVNTEVINPLTNTMKLTIPNSFITRYNINISRIKLLVIRKDMFDNTLYHHNTTNMLISSIFL